MNETDKKVVSGDEDTIGSNQDVATQVDTPVDGDPVTLEGPSSGVKKPREYAPDIEDPDRDLDDDAPFEEHADPLQDDVTAHDTSAKIAPDELEADTIGDPVDQEAVETSEDADQDIDPVADPDPAPAAAVPPQQVVVRKGGFVPMLLGGLVSAAIGFGLARFVIPDGWPIGAAQTQVDPFEAEMRSTLEAQSGRIDALQDKIPQAVVTASDLDPLGQKIEAIAASSDESKASIGRLENAIDDVLANVSGLEGRLTNLEKKPFEGAVSQAAIDAYERELAALQKSVATQRAEIETVAAEAAASKQEALAQQNAAAAMAQASLARAALTQVASALDSGGAYDEPLSEFRSAAGVAIPEALSAHASKGVITLDSLQKTFPDVARRALAAARSNSSDEGNAGLGSFLARQLSARSVTPREGDDPDAVLSRAEAAVRTGDIEQALTEIGSLPDVAQPALTSWKENASTRQAALAAVQALFSDLGNN